MRGKPEITGSHSSPWGLSGAWAEGGTEETRVQDARLLGQLQVVLLVLGVMAILLEFYLARDDRSFYEFGRITGYVAIGSIAGCYALNRLGYFRLSVVLSVLFPAYYIIQAPLIGPGPPQVWWMVYLLVPIVIANTFLRKRMVVVLAASFIVALLLIPTFAPVNVYSLPVMFIVLSTALLLIGRRHAERQERARRAELSQSRERYRGLLETVFEGVVIEEGGRVVEVNQGAADMFGYASGGQMPARMSECIPEWEQLAGDAEAGCEARGLRAGGSAMVLDMVVRPLPSAHGGARIVALRDVTERREAERERRALQAQVMRSQKLESLGILAGGMAHDFNNMLTAILGQAELMRFDADGDARVEKAALAIEHAARRAAELTQKLLNFARRGSRKLEPFSLHELVREVNDLLRRTLDRNVDIREDLSAEVSVVQGDASQMQQVLMNLAINGSDAMPEGGQLHFRTESITVCAADILCEAGLTPGLYVKLTVRDAGTGMPPETLDRIFDPFFTTKSQGKGTGLGLAMVYGIVETHQGLIVVESEPGKGTSFQIYLPVTATQRAPQKREEAAPDRGFGEVLLVDDEPDVRDAVGSMLVRLGYEVTTAVNGQEAVDIYEARPGAFRLVVLDMVMPVMDGASCFRRLQAINPGVRALLSTGYDINDRVQEVLDNGMRGFVRKPYRLHELAEAINIALADDSPGAP